MSDFVARNKKDWEKLEALIKRGRRSVRRLSADERRELDQLYRKTTVHLARASTWSRDQYLISYLNALTAGAHSLLYVSPRPGIFRGAVNFLTEGFARAVARNWKMQLLAAALVLCGGLIGYFAAVSDLTLLYAMWPANETRQPGSTPDQLLEHLRSGREQGGGEKFVFASFLFQHNLRVSLLAMAAGFLAGIPSMLLLLMNGVLLGVFVAIHHQAGIRSEMWAWILPHGITEFGAIILCGGVGLMLGQAVVNPGWRTRKQALVAAGGEGLRICMGCAVMLLMAAWIESYVRQSHWTTGQRLTFAAITALFWGTYLAVGFVTERRASAPSVSAPNPKDRAIVDGRVISPSSVN